MADTDIVVAIDKVSGKTSMIAVPRDTMVDVDVFDKDGNFKRPRKWSFVLPMLTATASAPPARM